MLIFLFSILIILKITRVEQHIHIHGIVGIKLTLLWYLSGYSKVDAWYNSIQSINSPNIIAEIRYKVSKYLLTDEYKWFKIKVVTKITPPIKLTIFIIIIPVLVS